MTQPLEVTDTPVDLVATLSLQQGSVYTLEALVTNGSVGVRYFEAAAAPADRSYFHNLGNGEVRAVRPISGLAMWVWCAAGETARVVVTPDA